MRLQRPPWQQPFSDLIPALGDRLWKRCRGLLLATAIGDSLRYLPVLPLKASVSVHGRRLLRSKLTAPTVLWNSPKLEILVRSVVTAFVAAAISNGDKEGRAGRFGPGAMLDLLCNETGRFGV